MRKDIIYNEWIPYIDYEKSECDIKLKDGTIVYHCWPNAGKFNPLCSNMNVILEEEVVEIMYRSYYLDDACKGNCNGDNPERELEYVAKQASILDFIEPCDDSTSYIDWETFDGNWSNFPMREPILPFVREEPKVQRNEPCPCGSGKKYKKCCI